MLKRFEIYRCNVCGNMVEGLNSYHGTLSCCGQPMEKLVENTTDAAAEKHVPVLEKKEHSVEVKVGSVPHPMLEEHYIEWIEIHTDHRSQRKYLQPGDTPAADFSCPPTTCCTGNQPVVRAYCNLHGLWEGAQS